MPDLLRKWSLASPYQTFCDTRALVAPLYLFWLDRHSTQSAETDKILNNNNKTKQTKKTTKKLRLLFRRLKLIMPRLCIDASYKTTRPGCAKLTTSLVNVSLKFQTLISQICQYFFVEKMREAFAVQKLLSFFRQKISLYEVIMLLNT